MNAEYARIRDYLKAQGAKLPPLNWRETLLFMRLHDLDHAGQLDKIAATLAATPVARA